MKLQWTLASAGLLIALAACQPKTGTDSGANLGPPVATVDGRPIEKEVYEFYVKSVAGKPSSELTAEQRDQALENLIRAQVIAEQADKEGLTKDTNTAALIELSRLNVLNQALSDKYLKDKKPTEQELRAEYETQVAAMSRNEYHAKHILVATSTFAEKLVKDLEKGAKFEDIAKRESMDSSKDSGGDLGWFTPDRMVKPFSDAVVALKPGEYTHTPVQTQYGWHIIKLEETRELAPPPFDQVKQRLDQVIQAKKFKTYVDGLLKTAKVEKKLEAAPAAPAAADSGGSAPAAPAPSEKPAEQK
ncbi:MAG TPA: peptidylprolyl isomerase [Steroidobacteraceae bacterium]|jgi:peptidyl-prolyl cis-trans isomerase C|nr:peptidylprolyl isomerase [Steroidobacteraceae bacterium]